MQKRTGTCHFLRLLLLHDRTMLRVIDYRIYFFGASGLMLSDGASPKLLRNCVSRAKQERDNRVGLSICIKAEFLA
jgi:hypothetical protein